MFKRKISSTIEDYFDRQDGPILCISGARQVGKSYIINHIAKNRFKNYIELNMADDFNGLQSFKNVGTIDDFYLQVSIIAGNKLGEYKDTLIFIDEIQIYPHLLTLLKPLHKDHKYQYICSGSQLGVALSNTTLIPMGSMSEVKMYPMDFEEFLMACNVGIDVIEHMQVCFKNVQPIEESLHNHMLKLFKTYLFTGGMPDAIKAYVETNNVQNVRKIQTDIIKYYGEDASKYDQENRLKIRRIYDMVPSNIDNKVKRIQYSKIEGKKDVRYLKYQDEFDYLFASGIVLDTLAISEPKFPLVQSSSKSLTKLYMNDVGLLTNILYSYNINPMLNDIPNINLGAVYETAVAQELKAHQHKLYYYDRKKVGEVDFLIDDYDTLSVVPIEVKSGNDANNFRAIPKLVNNPAYQIQKGYILSNKRDVIVKDNLIHIPIYYVMFI